jgi:AcrR family transcriptional regulator
MDKKNQSRTTKRKERIHEDILEVAAKLINVHGSAGVTLDQIAKTADVARKTIYNHFDNKESLIKELVIPVCNHAIDYLDTVSKDIELTLDHIWDYCLELWEDESLHASLLYRISLDDWAEMTQYTHGFIYVFSALLKSIPEYVNVSEASLKLMSNTIYQTYIPLLQSISKEADYQIRFKQCMTGLMSGFNSLKSDSN